MLVAFNKCNSYVYVNLKRVYMKLIYQIYKQWAFISLLADELNSKSKI